MGNWTLFSNHGHVLLYLAGNNEARLRDVAGKVGITERAVQKIVSELQEAEYLTVTKHGRCNHYRIHARKPLRHPIESHCTVAALVQLVSDSAPAVKADPVPAPQGKERLAKAKKPEPGKETTKAPPIRPPRTASESRKPEPATRKPQPAARKQDPAAPRPAAPQSQAPKSDATKPETPGKEAPRKKAPKKEEDSGEPVDSRQQGSLF